jgi:hypothetical protein
MLRESVNTWAPRSWEPNRVVELFSFNVPPVAVTNPKWTLQ